jgi:hypothetical protein
VLGNVAVTRLHNNSGNIRRCFLSGPPGWGSLESERVKCGHESHRTLTWGWQRWRGPAAIINDRSILSSERMLHKDYKRRCSVENKIIGRESQGIVAKSNWLAVKRQS